jgi:hypothetical protein
MDQLFSAFICRSLSRKMAEQTFADKNDVPMRLKSEKSSQSIKETRFDVFLQGVNVTIIFKMF